jgi:hypothetical protein
VSGVFLRIPGADVQAAAVPIGEAGRVAQGFNIKADYIVQGDGPEEFPVLMRIRASSPLAKLARFPVR